jgi:hypothetical protein
LKCNINLSFNLTRKDTALKKYITYKWTNKSKEKLTNCICSDTLIKQVVHFEQEEFENNITGINSATRKITLIFDNISKNVCKIKRLIVYKKKRKKPWSDRDVKNIKSRINLLGKEL